MKYQRVCLLLLLSCCSICNQSLANDIIKIKPAWKTSLSYKDWMDMHPAVMKATDGYFVMGISDHKTDSNEYEYKVTLWKISPEGKELWAKDVKLDSWGEKFVPHHCFAIQDEQIVLMIGSSNAWLMHFDDNGEVIFSKELSIPQFDNIRGIEKTDDGLFLYGSVYKGNSGVCKIKGNSDACKIKSNSDALVIKLSNDGNEIWRREYDKGKMEWGTGLTPLKDGGFILSADSGIYNKFGGGPSEAWIVKCDTKGKILKETIFEGRHPSVIINGDIAAVVFNKEDFPQQDIGVAGLDKKLKTRWRIDSLFGKRDGLGMLATIVNKKGNFVLAGSKFGAAGLWEISKEGKIIKEYEIESSEFGAQLGLMQTSNGYIICGFSSNMSKIPLTADGKAAKGVHWDSADIQIAEIADTNN